MSGIATLANASVHQVAGPIVMPMATIIGVIPLMYWIFGCIPAASALASAGVQQRKASTTGNRLAANHTSLAHSTSLLTHPSDRKPTRGTVYALTRRCC